MISYLKEILYFPGAWIFRFFASIRLKLWKPYIIVVTGSSGKTTMMHLLESQFQEKARYTHHANSAYGIPFDILDIHRKTLVSSEWIGIVLSLPFSVFRPLPKQTIYIVEADCDRPGEGAFLSGLLRPHMTLWASCARTHSLNFDPLVRDKKFSSVDDAIAYEFGHFVARTREHVLTNSDNDLIKKQLPRTQAQIHTISLSALVDYSLSEKGVHYKTSSEVIDLPYVLPQEVYYGIEMSKIACEIKGISYDKKFLQLEMPPGRNSVFHGIHNTTIIDSSYNANLTSMKAILSMYEKIQAKKKWMVIGDMLELGSVERSEHEELARMICRVNPERCILLGKLTHLYTYPILEELLGSTRILKLQSQKEALEYLTKNLPDNISILFKGSQSIFLEGIIEHLLADKGDAADLCRREKVWQMKRQALGM